MGLVEIGVGLLPGGGGTKEMCLRAVQTAQQYETDVQPFIFKNFRADRDGPGVYWCRRAVWHGLYARR